MWNPRAHVVNYRVTGHVDEYRTHEPIVAFRRYVVYRGRKIFNLSGSASDSIMSCGSFDPNLCYHVHNT